MIAAPARSPSCAALLVALAAAWPLAAQAQFDSSRPEDVGLAIVSIEPDRETDRSVAFLLEDFIRANLQRLIDHPLSIGPDLAPALPNGIEACVADASCVQLLGGQFNSSLLVVPRLVRAGSELTLECDWYATGNGLKLAREFPTYTAGDERGLVQAIAGHFRAYFDSSLRVAVTNRAGEGTILGSERGEQARRREELDSARRKKVSSRREEYGSTTRRRDDASDLRAAVEDDPDAEPAADVIADRRDDSGNHSERRDSTDRRASTEEDPEETWERRRQQREERERKDADIDVSDSDLSVEGLDEDEELDRDRTRRSRAGGAYSGRDDRSRSGTTVRKAGDGREPSLEIDEDEIVDLDAVDTGDTVVSYVQAQKLGYGKRAYRRYVNSGQPFAEYHDGRWLMGRRLSFRVGAYWGGGYLMRRYASTIYVQVGGLKTDEYWWERLRATFVNPGFSLGVGFAPLDFLSVELDVSLMYSQSTLRREYVNPERGTNIPATPDNLPRAHFLTDLRVRAYVNPRSRVKFAPGVGATVVVMSPYTFPNEDPNTAFRWSERPTAVLVGVTPTVGMVASLTPFVSLYADIAPTIYVTRGAAHAQGHDLYNGVTEPRLPVSAQEQPYRSDPIMGRILGGAMILF